MYLIKSESLNSGSITFPIPKGSIKDIIIRITGTNKAGVTLAVGEVGKLRLTRKGFDIVGNVDFQDLRNINNYEMGISPFASAVGAAFSGQVVVPFHYPQDELNILKFLADEGEFQFVVDPTGLAKMEAGALMQVFAVFSKGVEKYLRVLLLTSRVLGASGATTVHEIMQRNVTQLYIRGGASDISNAIITRDNLTLINAAGAALVELTNQRGKIETAGTFILLDFAPTKSPAESISSTMQLHLTSAAASPTSVLVVDQMLFDAQRTQDSVSSFNRYEAVNVAKDVQASVLKQVASAT